MPSTKCSMIMWCRIDTLAWGMTAQGRSIVHLGQATNVVFLGAQAKPAPEAGETPALPGTGQAKTENRMALMTASRP